MLSLRDSPESSDLEVATGFEDGDQRAEPSLLKSHNFFLLLLLFFACQEASPFAHDALISLTCG